MTTETLNQNIFVNTILNLKQRGVIQDLPLSLSNPYSTPRVDHLRENQTQKNKFSYSDWHEQNAFQNTRADSVLSQQSFPSKREVSVNTIGRYSAVSTSMDNATRCSTSLIQTDCLFQPIDSNIVTDRELNNTQSSLGSLMIEDNEETHIDATLAKLQKETHREKVNSPGRDINQELFGNYYEVISNCENTFDCFPSGFESDYSSHNTEDLGISTIQQEEQPTKKDNSIQLGKISKFSVPLKYTQRHSRGIVEDDTIVKISEQIGPTNSKDMLLNDQVGDLKDEEINLNKSSVCMEAETSDTTKCKQTIKQSNRGLDKDITNKKRGIKR